MLLRYWIFVLLLCTFTCSSHADVKHYVVEGWINDDDYVSKLLKLILNASKAPNEVIELKYNKLYDLQLSPSRRVAEFAKLNGNLVMWTVTDKERESFLHPIRVPIFRGLFGYRVLIIRKQDQAKFANIKTRRELTALIAGQGDQWPDTDVLRNNGVPVITGSQVENIYKMLAAKRFDYFPRGIVEIAPELSLINFYNLMVVPDLLLEYPNPLYFFVNKSNHELAQRLQRGWEIIIADGSFDRLFFDEVKVQTALQYLKPIPRYIWHLQNADLPQETPLTTSRYWLPLSQMEDLPQ